AAFPPRRWNHPRAHPAPPHPVLRRALNASSSSPPGPSSSSFPEDTGRAKMLMPFSIKENGLLFPLPTPRIRKTGQGRGQIAFPTITGQPARKTRPSHRVSPQELQPSGQSTEMRPLIVWSYENPGSRRLPSRHYARRDHLIHIAHQESTVICPVRWIPMPQPSVMEVEQHK